MELIYQPSHNPYRIIANAFFKRNSFQAGLSEDEYELSDIYDDVV